MNATLFFSYEKRLLLLKVLSAFFVLTALIGIFRNYSAVPYWDMWGGNLGFYFRIQEGDWMAWWAQHNEHRILLSRLLFWIDFHFFNGNHILLFVMNALLATLGFGVFYQYVRDLYPDPSSKEQRSVWMFILLATSFCWIQADNLICAFQSQFFLAQSLPLLGFYALYRASQPTGSERWFIGACVLGLLSGGTMANGVLTLPLMTSLAVLLKFNRTRILSLLLLTTLVWWAYFYDYATPADQGSLLHAFAMHPKTIIQFALVYLGGPFYYLVPLHWAPQASVWLAFAAGICWMALFLRVAHVTWQTRQMSGGLDSWRLALLGFLTYIAGTALATALARYHTGTEGALASRYMTPALMGWLAMALLWIPTHTQALNRLLPPLILLLPAQIMAIHSRDNSLFERDIAALAANLSIKDEMQIKTIEPSPESVLALAPQAIEQNLSVFGTPVMQNARKILGQLTALPSAPPCALTQYRVASIQSDAAYLKIAGNWSEKGLRPSAIQFLNLSHRVIGYALTHKPGFKGYVLQAEWEQGPTMAVGLQPTCVSLLQ